MIVVVIVVCEILFWVFIGLGLIARYLLHARRAGAVLLALSPVTDLALLVATALDLAAGGTATAAHGLAALYLGFSVAYGHATIRWADVRFAYRFAGGPAPVKQTGAGYTRACWRDVLRTLLGAAVALAVIGALVLIAGEPERSAAVTAFVPVLGIAVAADLAWAVSYTIWPRRDPRMSANY
ncbi:hypothetical protein [Leifsonia aquatica]|uniref:hypothetical protein n=1 Tax=Leifsonia aquatica TaxID=144185 RepID=UPI00046ACD4F|nr:hypothetical protein [Leifsonia aquatica]